MQLRAESKAETERKDCVGKGNCGEKHQGLRLVGWKTEEWGEWEGLQLPKGAGGCSLSWREIDGLFLGFSFLWVYIYIFCPFLWLNTLFIEFFLGKIPNQPSACAPFSI